MDFVTKRIGEFGEKQMTGINLAVKSAAKKFKFIIGWELAENWDKWPAMLSINLIVDLEKVGEYYDVKMSDYWLEQWQSDELVQSLYVLTLTDVTSPDSPDETKKINKTLTELYNIIPEQFSTFYVMESDKENYTFKCFIQVHHFQNKPTQKIYYSIK